MSDFKATIHQIQFRPDPAEGASALPKPLAGFKRPTSKNREGEMWNRRKEG